VPCFVVALKGVGGPTDGSVVMMPGGELIQVGRAISIANIDQKKRPAFGRLLIALI